MPTPLEGRPYHLPPDPPPLQITGILGGIEGCVPPYQRPNKAALHPPPKKKYETKRAFKCSCTQPWGGGGEGDVSSRNKQKQNKRAGP